MTVVSDGGIRGTPAYFISVLSVRREQLNQVHPKTHIAEQISAIFVHCIFIVENSRFGEKRRPY